MEVSELDTTSLVRVVERGFRVKELIDQVMKCGRIEGTSSVSISRLKDEEK